LVTGEQVTRDLQQGRGRESIVGVLGKKQIKSGAIRKRHHWILMHKYNAIRERAVDGIAAMHLDETRVHQHQRIRDEQKFSALHQ
jgi:hypothetical protein